MFYIPIVNAQLNIKDKTGYQNSSCLENDGVKKSEIINQKSDLPIYKYLVSENVTDFVKKLNELGKCGYRLDKVTKAPLKIGKTFNELNLAAIVKLDSPNKYEYDWFEAFTPGEITTRLNYRAKQGFRLRDSIHTVAESRGAADPDSDDEFLRLLATINDTLAITSGNVFFLERKNNEVVELGDRRVIIGSWGWGKSPTVELQQELENIIELGFSPIHQGFIKIYNSYAVFLVMKKDETVTELGQKNHLTYQTLKSEYSFEKKVNRLASEGFKILFYDKYGAYGFATMVKESQPSNLVSYHFVDVTEKIWQDKIVNLSKQGAIYKSVGTAAINSYPDSFEGNLVFEKLLSENNQRVEYKILKMSKDFRKNKNNLSFDLLSLPEESITEFDKLLKEGFTVRELFFADGINILFEKIHPNKIELD